MNILLKKSLPTFGLELPKDFDKARKEGVDFKIADNYLIEDAFNKGPGTWEYDEWLPQIKISTYRMIVHGLIYQLSEAKKPWYVKLFKKYKKFLKKSV